MLLPRNAPAWLERLSRWFEPFEREFGHVAQRGAFRRYLLGLLSVCRRKSLSAMIERVHEPYLIEKGFLIRTARGRIATEKARAHLAQARAA